MTINELLLKHKNKIKINNLNLDKNYLITFDDVINESICQKYNANSLNVFSNYGLYYYDNNVIFLYNKIDRIEIISSKNNISCEGGSINIQCFAIINVYNDEKIFKTIRHKINPLYSFENCNFNYINNTIYIDKNFEYKDREIKINAKYGYNGILYKSSLIINQNPNFDSDWINGEEEINDIIITSSKNKICSSGDTINITVKKVSVINLYKKDYFGKVTKTKTSDTLITDITNDSAIKVNSPFKIIDNNKILFPSQNPNSLPRFANISCKYKNYVKELGIEQEKGPVITYDNVFSFDDGSEYKIINLTNSLETTVNVSIISSKIRLLDGIEYDKIDDSNFSIINNNNWLECYIDYEELLLNVQISKNNTNDIRNGNIELINKDKKILLCISQMPKTEIRCEYGVLINCDDELLLNKTDDYTILYKPFKKIYYDDNSFEIFEYLEPFHKLDVIYNYDNEDNLSITSPKMIDFNGTHESKLRVKDDNKCNVIGVKISCRILDNSLNQISDIYYKNITLQFKKPNIKEIEVTINVINSSNYPTASSVNCPKFTIINSINNIVYETNISRFWVTSDMNSDLVYLGNIALNENEKYKFNIEKFYYLNKSTDEISDEYLIENDDAGIDLSIKI